MAFIFILGFPFLKYQFLHKYEQTKVNRYSPNVKQIHLFPEPRRSYYYEIGHTVTHTITEQSVSFSKRHQAAF